MCHPTTVLHTVRRPRERIVWWYRTLQTPKLDANVSYFYCWTWFQHSYALLESLCPVTLRKDSLWVSPSILVQRITLKENITCQARCQVLWLFTTFTTLSPKGGISIPLSGRKQTQGGWDSQQCVTNAQLGEWWSPILGQAARCLTESLLSRGHPNLCSKSPLCWGNWTDMGGDTLSPKLFIQSNYQFI